MENRNRLFTFVAPPTIYLLLFFILPLGIMAVFSFRRGRWEWRSPLIHWTITGSF